MGRTTFVIELAADERFAKDLAAGGVFVPAHGLRVMDELDLVVCGGAGELTLHARVVYVDPAKGAGLELVGFGAAIKEQLAQLAATPAEHETVAATQVRRQRVLTSPGVRRSPQARDIAMIELDDLGDVESVIADAVPEDAIDDAVTDKVAAAETEDDATRTPSGRIALNANERLRGLTLAQQIKVARGPSASERMALERMYGKNVWEALLHNPGLTVPEVARLSRLGTLPRVLLEVIVNNNTWLQVPEVRRALLANPRLGTDQVMRVLRLLPKHELKLAVQIPAYPHSVRSMAKKLVDE